MAAPDMDVIKDIPGYKVILKAVLKSQIQQLVEQLASHTDEESIILTASVSDGTLSHLGSDSGKHFLEDNEDVKSQFLGHCLKYHHKRKQEKEREKQQQEQQQHQLQQQMASQQYGMRPNFMRSPRQQFPPRYPSPRNAGPIRSPLGSGVRHSPYPVTRPMRVPRPNFDAGPRGGMPLRPLGDQVIKIEPDDDSNQSDSNPQPSSAQSSSQPGSPSQPSTSTSAVKAESSDKDDDAHSESSSSTIPLSDRKFTDGVPPEGLSLDSDLSGLISGDQSQSGIPSTSQGQSGGSDSIDPNVSVKLEAITDAEMELEITGVEPGTRPVMPSGSQDWSQQGTMGYDPMGAAGNQSDMQAGDQGYSADDYILPIDNKLFKCLMCGKRSGRRYNLLRHIRIHLGERPFSCHVCDKPFTDSSNMRRHLTKHEMELLCTLCQSKFEQLSELKSHMRAVHQHELKYTWSTVL